MLVDLFILKDENLFLHGDGKLNPLHSFNKMDLETEDIDYDSIVFSEENPSNERFDFPRLNKFDPNNFDYYTAEKFNKFLQSNSNVHKSLKILHLNIRGLETHYQDLVLFLNTLNTSFDVITLSECHLRNSNTYLNRNRFTINGYNNFFVFSCIGYGGCAVYAKKELHASQIHSLTNTSKFSDHTYIEISNKCKKKLVIGVYYRHNISTKKDILGFIDEFENHLNHKALKNSRLVITGDMNLDLFQVNTNTSINCYFNCLLSNNLESHITKPTRIAYYKNSLQIKSATLIDHISSNILDTDCISGNFYYSDSDHFPNFVIFENFFDQKTANCNNDEFYRRNTSKINQDSLNNDINNIDWYTSVCNDDLDLDTAVENLFENVQNLCDKHAPKVKVSNRKTKYCNKPWIDNELVHLIRQKNCMYRKMKKLPTSINTLSFKQTRNLVNHKTRIKKKLYFDNYFNIHKKNMKKSWEGIRYAMELSNNKKSIPNTMRNKATGLTYDNPQSIVDQFAIYFESVPRNCINQLNRNKNVNNMYDCYNCNKPTGKKFAVCSICHSIVHKKCINSSLECHKCSTPDEVVHFSSTKYINNNSINNSNKNQYLQYLRLANVNSIYFSDVTPNEVLGHIFELKNNSSSGPSDIPNIFMKIIALQLAFILTYLVNRSFKEGYFPKLLKVGKQTPVFKSGENYFSNYRPITVCNSIAKIFEKLARTRLLNFIEKFNILNCNQFGFRKSHSTDHAMINLYDTCLDGLDNKLTTGSVFLDISKAFDCVDHDILLYKLNHYGIRGVVYQWFKSYLTDRKQYVEVKGCRSHEYNLDFGVPQGSVIGPLLFLIFINDIIYSSDMLNFTMFADDTSLILCIDREAYRTTLKIELERVMKWFENNLLLLNFDKTDYLFCGPYYRMNISPVENDLLELHQCVTEYIIQHKVLPGYMYHTLDDKGAHYSELNKKGEFISDELHRVVPQYLYKEHIVIKNEIIVESSEIKYLGVIFESNQTFKKHIHTITSKLNRLVGIFWKCRDLNMKTKLTMYHSFVASQLNYGIIAWGSQFASNLIGDSNLGLTHIPENFRGGP